MRRRSVNGPDTDGIDFKAEYTSLAPGSVARGCRRDAVAWNIAGWLFDPSYDAIRQLNYDTSLARTVVDLKARTWIAVHMGDINLRWTVHHTATYKHDGDAEPRIAAHTTHEIAAAWSLLEDRVVLEAAVFNVGDREPPQCLTTTQLRPADAQPVGSDRSAWRAVAYLELLT